MEWSAVAVPGAEGFAGRLFRLPPHIGPKCVNEADEIVTGTIRLFSFHVFKLGDAPDWSVNLFTKMKVPTNRHWSKLGDFAFGDMKAVWELSRFSWAFPLARAYARTKDNQYAERFWALFESWMAHAQPNCGPNWMCGQEAAFRLMAVVFARDVLADAEATTPKRIRQFDALVTTTGARIASNLAYALSQKNNHGISECVGLITAALLVPEIPAASAWWRLGLAGLQTQLGELVYADGAFAQHSANYHRLLLHDCLWCVAMLRGRGKMTPPWLLNACRRALLFLDGLITEETGRVPLYGANDGANVLPLSDSDYLDFRPVVQAGYAVLDGKSRFKRGPWDEAADWLAGSDSFRAGLTVEPRPARFHARDGGCLLWRSGESRLFLRCPERFAHRPSQADLLHADIEIRGEPVAIDAGTYSYNTVGHFASAMKDAALHNTIVIDGREPMRKAGRFLYLPWPRGQAGWNTLEQRFTATRHDGMTRNVSSLRPDEFVIRDEIARPGRHVARLHWLLADLPYAMDEQRGLLRLRSPTGDIEIAWRVPVSARVSLARADPQSARGWCSPYYLKAAPALSLVIEVDFEDAVWLETRFGPTA